MLAGLRYAAGKCYTHAVTIDSDGQHMPEDISLLIDASLKEPDMLWVGSRNLSASNMPGKIHLRTDFQISGSGYRPV